MSRRSQSSSAPSEGGSTAFLSIEVHILSRQPVDGALKAYKGQKLQNGKDGKGYSEQRPGYAKPAAGGEVTQEYGGGKAHTRTGEDEADYMHCAHKGELDPGYIGIHRHGEGGAGGGTEQYEFAVIQQRGPAGKLLEVIKLGVVVNGDDRENILKNAPEQKDGAFVVPKTFEE